MEGYRPFLVPLAHLPVEGSGSRQKVLAGSPLEEETLLREFHAREHVNWERLAEKVENAFGVPLLVQLPDKAHSPECVGDPSRTTPDRFLVAQTRTVTFFLIEQPASIHLIDQYSQEDQFAAIARPTLFARLWREMENAATNPAGGDLIVEESGEDPAPALQGFIRGLILSGRPSDWHLEPQPDGFRSRLRIDGQLREETLLPRAKGDWLVNSLVSVIGLKDTTGRACEGQLHQCLPGGEEIPLRISMVPSQYGMAVVIRFLYPMANNQLSLDSLGLEQEDVRLLEKRYKESRGLWLVVGPTGSGKSTTLRAFMQRSIQAREKVLSIEDPVEFPLDGAHHLSVGSPPGLTWSGAVRAFLRQAPDSVLIGEIRDEETAAIALQAARTGHRILSTLHARDDSGVKRRFSDLGQDPASLEKVCACILHQRLLPMLCPHCRVLHPVSNAQGFAIKEAGLPIPETLAASRGCERCHSGIKGRVPVLAYTGFRADEQVAVKLGKSAWQRVMGHDVSAADAMPYLPETLRQFFGICQQ